MQSLEKAKKIPIFEVTTWSVDDRRLGALSAPAADIAILDREDKASVTVQRI